jgi:membrane protease subunit HflC
MKPTAAILVALALLAGLLLSASCYVVDQRQRAIVFQFGEVRDVVEDPGLHFKLPLIQNVRYFDTRILTLDTRDAERVTTEGNVPVLVDSFVKWRIRDARQFYLSVDRESIAQDRLNAIVRSELSAEFGRRKLEAVISTERDEIMERLRDRVNKAVAQLGIDVIDVRVKRIELPQDVSERTFARMVSERQRAANEMRSGGAAEGEKIRADADRQRSVLVAEAYSEAQRIKGEGDAKAAAIYNKAFSADPEFYAFYRSLDAYRATLQKRSDVLVLDPNVDFLRYLRSPNPSRGVKQ